MIRRFYFSGTGNGILHRVYSKIHSEGEPAKCGRRVQKGWLWRHRVRGDRVCKSCA